jgi:hypothetical protein
VTFTPTAANAYSANVTVNTNAATAGLTGTGFVLTKPTLNVLDTFNRANANNLNSNFAPGNNWSQVTLPIVGAALQVNTNQANAPGLAGQAYWNTTTFGAKQAAAITLSSTNLNTDGVLLGVTGGAATLPQNWVRVQYNSGASTVTVAYTTNFGGSFTTAATLTGTSFANGDTITAELDGTLTTPTVYVWKTTSANVTTLVGQAALTGTTAFAGGGRIGFQLPGLASGVSARADNFAGGNVP